MQVYAINNIANGKLYIGQHAGEDLIAYLKHNIRAALRNAGNKTFLYRAIRKYGGDNFTIRCIHKCVDKLEMDRAEKAYIKFFGTQDPVLGYNITAGGGGRLGTKNPHTEEQKKNMSRIMKGRILTAEWKKKIGDAQRGRPLTEAHKAALKGSQLGVKKSPRSPEHCEKIRENKRKWWALRKQEVDQCQTLKTV